MLGFDFSKNLNSGIGKRSEKEKIIKNGTPRASRHGAGKRPKALRWILAEVDSWSCKGKIEGGEILNRGQCRAAPAGWRSEDHRRGD